MTTSPEKVARAEEITADSSGEVLREDFMKPYGLTPYRVAKDTRVPVLRINRMAKGERGI